MPKQQWGYTYRVFGGRQYRIGTWHSTKAEAMKKADKLRRYGYSVRIVKRRSEGKTRYVIYAR